MKHMKMFQKLMEKKQQEGSPLSDLERDAKSSVIKNLQDHMSSMMGDKLGNLKKVSVASNSKEGLEEGLKKAQEITSKMPGEKEGEEMKNEAEDGHDRGNGDMFEGGSGEHEEDEESPEHEASESAEEEEKEHSDDKEDHASIDAKIEELMKKKAALKHKGY